MAKGWLKIVLLIVSLILGYGIMQFWPNLRPDDPPEWAWGAGLAVAFASFVSMHFMTKGGGE